MKFLKYFFIKAKKCIKGLAIASIPYLFFVFIAFIAIAGEGYTWEDFGLDGFSLNPNDYCNLTDVEYIAVLHDDPNGNANVEITEYLTFDVHAASQSNTYKELWRELPEEYVDGLKVTYDVKSVTQILDNGTEVPYKETSKMYWEDYDYTPSSTMYWHHSDGSGSYPDNDESVLIYIPWTYREKMTFKIVYSMNNAALKYNDCSELYLSMYSGNTIKKLNSFKAQILIPNEIMPTTYHTYTFGTANDRIPYSESSTINPGYHTFSIDLDKSDLKFNYHNRYIEFCLLAYGKDKHIFTKYAPYNRYTYQNVLDECIAENEYYKTQNEKYDTWKIVLLVASIVLAIIAIYGAKRKYIKLKEKYQFYEPENDYEYFRDIPRDLDPIFASQLVFMKDPFNEHKEKKEEYAAVLLSLARKKYVTISKVDNNKDWSLENSLISIEPVNTTYTSAPFNDTPGSVPSETIYTTKNENTGEILEPLSTSERLYLELLERHSKMNKNSVTISNFQQCLNNDTIHTNAFVKDIESKPATEIGILGGYFQQTDYSSPQKLLKESANTSLKLGLILLIAVNAISYFTPIGLAYGAYTILGIALLIRATYLTYKSSNAVLFTQFGANEQAKWYGLYNFLNSDTLIKEREIHELPLWEKYLIYATAFGISEKVINAIKIHAAELNFDTSPILNSHCYIHSTKFHVTSRALGHHIHSSSRGGGFGGSRLQRQFWRTRLRRRRSWRWWWRRRPLEKRKKR